MPNPETPHAEHLEAVRRDWNSRTEEWRVLYDGGTFLDHTIRQRLARALAHVDAIGASGPVLDVGCGAGQALVELAQRGLEVHGCDLAEEMVAESQDRMAGAGVTGDVRVAEVESLPYEDGRFAWVTALGVIEYLPTATRALAEMARVLAPRGHLVVTAPNPLRLAYLADPVGVVRVLKAPPRGGYRRRYFTHGKLARTVAAAGLGVVEVVGHGLGPLAVARRPLMSDARAVALDGRLARRLPAALASRLGANLVCLARKPH
ncbi:MAG: class I SAM-dependent methyltransferase [Acidimicrobiia bacterium]